MIHKMLLRYFYAYSLYIKKLDAEKDLVRIAARDICGSYFEYFIGKLSEDEKAAWEHAEAPEWVIVRLLNEVECNDDFCGEAADLKTVYEIITNDLEGEPGFDISEDFLELLLSWG